MQGTLSAGGWAADGLHGSALLTSFQMKQHSIRLAMRRSRAAGAEDLGPSHTQVGTLEHSSVQEWMFKALCPSCETTLPCCWGAILLAGWLSCWSLVMVPTLQLYCHLVQCHLATVLQQAT